MNKTLLLLGLFAATHAGAAYKCVDAKGRTHIGDTPPEACADVVMYEVHKSGAIIRKIDPAPTADQLRQKAEDSAKKREAERAAAEQKRKDQTLLQTFSSEKEFDVVRDRNIEPLKGRIKAAEDRMKAVEKREKELADELEFYTAGKSGKADKSKKGAEAPKNLTDEQERLRAEKGNLARSIAGFNKEIEEIRVKFDADKKRWVALKGDTAPSAQPVAAPADPRKK